LEERSGGGLRGGKDSLRSKGLVEAPEIEETLTMIPRRSWERGAAAG